MLPDLAAFVRDHQAEPGPLGYFVTVACPCGVTFERWVTELDVAAGLLQFGLLTSWN